VGLRALRGSSFVFLKLAIAIPARWRAEFVRDDTFHLQAVDRRRTGIYGAAIGILRCDSDRLSGVLEYVRMCGKYKSVRTKWHKEICC
jgi:hypothetical protein